MDGEFWRDSETMPIKSFIRGIGSIIKLLRWAVPQYNNLQWFKKTKPSIKRTSSANQTSKSFLLPNATLKTIQKRNNLPTKPKKPYKNPTLTWNPSNLSVSKAVHATCALTTIISKNLSRAQGKTWTSEA